MSEEGGGLVLVNGHRDTLQSLCRQAEPVPTSPFLTPTPFLQVMGLEPGAASQQSLCSGRRRPRRGCVLTCVRGLVRIPGSPMRPE